MPVDSKQVPRVNVPESDALQFLLNFRRNFGRVFHLGISGDDDVALFGALNGAGAAVFVNGQVNCGHGILLMSSCQTTWIIAQISTNRAYFLSTVKIICSHIN